MKDKEYGKKYPRYFVRDGYRFFSYYCVFSPKRIRAVYRDNSSYDCDFFLDYLLKQCQDSQDRSIREVTKEELALII